MTAEIFTVRNLSEQMEYMWNSRDVENEINICYRRNILKIFLDYLPKKGQILEAGCGLGAWVLMLGRRGYEIKGIDIDEKVITAIKKYDPNGNVFVGDVCGLNEEDNSLAAYISLGVVEHFKEGPEKALKEAYRVLRDKGIIFLTVPYNSAFRRFIVHPLRNIFFLILKLKKKEIYFAEYRLTKKELINAVKNAGFNIMIVEPDDFIDRAFSFGLWADFPFLRGNQEYSLNIIGKIISFTIKLLPRWFAAAGIMVVGEKKEK
jgi:SAM-dependent methyltransferase